MTLKLARLLLPADGFVATGGEEVRVQLWRGTTLIWEAVAPIASRGTVREISVEGEPLP